jgi:flagellar motor switch protein FliM
MGTHEAVTQEELASLLTSLAAAEREGGRGRRGRPGAPRVHEARVHDFARSEGLSRAVVQALEGIYSSFARAATVTLSAYLHGAFEVSLLSLDQLSYRQFAGSVPEPTVAGVFSVSPLPGRAILELNPSIGFWIVDRLLGGEGEIVKAPRPLTELEKALIEGTLSRMLRELGTAWEEMVHLAPELIEIIDSVGAAEIAKPDDAVAVAWFEVTVGPIAGMASVCFPVISLKLGKVGAGLSEDAVGEGARAEVSSLWEGLDTAISGVGVNCVVRLGTTRISVAELTGLEKGDVLCLDRSVDESLEILVGDAPKFRCRPVASAKKLAVEILGDAS